MYSAEERDDYYKKAISFFNTCNIFEGVVQIGSGTIGYLDEYSDIDLMAAYFKKEDTLNAKSALIEFLNSIGSVYLWERKWSDTILGVSAYLKNGLNFDISFGPTQELIICSPQWKIAIDKTGNLTQHIEQDFQLFLKEYSNYGISEMTIFRCLNGIRRCNIALKRKDYIYAADMLNEARTFAVEIAIVNDGVKAHQFKSYNSLNKELQEDIRVTFPKELSLNGITEAKNNLQKLLLTAVESNSELTFDKKLWSIIA